MKTKVILLFILILSLFFRIYGLDWDQGQHLHPDERFLTMVVTAMRLPSKFSQYFDPTVTLLSPYNVNFGFYVYGTIPLVLTKIIGEIVNMKDYWNIHLLGRVLSALFDVGVVFLVYKITKKIINLKAAIYSAFIYSIMVLPIQLSHFFAVDTFLNFFTLLTFYLLIQLFPDPKPSYLQKHPSQIMFLSGISFSLALGCKISAAYFSPIIGLLFLSYLFNNHRPTSTRTLLTLFYGIVFSLSCLLSFRFFQPHIFSSPNYTDFNINSRFISNIKELQSFSNPDTWFPPAIQWKTTQPLLFPFINLFFWGVGLPLAALIIFSIVYQLFKVADSIRKKSITLNHQLVFIILLWICGYFVFQGIQFVKTMRYFLFIYPFLAIISGESFVQLINHFKDSHYKIVQLFIFIIVFIYPISFLSIYSKKISRVTASEWIYQTIPAGSVLSFEHWDDALPANFTDHFASQYTQIELPMYGPDTPEKWLDLEEKFSKIDYLIMSSNRLYGTIPKHPDYYPQSSVFYKSLLSDTSTRFKKIAEFTSRPCFPPIGKPLFCFNDDNAEEAFTVYDHPKVLIYKKK